MSNKDDEKKVSEITKEFVGQMGSFRTQKEWLDDVLSRINRIYGQPEFMLNQVMSRDEVSEVKQIFMKESNLLEVVAPVKILGDIHGQFQDMQRLFDVIGRVPDERLLFLGDYVDRGKQSLEVCEFMVSTYPLTVFDGVRKGTLKMLVGHNCNKVC